MERNLVIFLHLFFIFFFLHGCHAIVKGTNDGSEKWGYTEVRPKAHMFWWLYKSPYKVEHATLPWPIILWLQGGPGSSGVGTGNFLEIGPLDWTLKPRTSTWLKKAHLLFVDSPVGAGFSYVENDTLLNSNEQEAASDLVTLLKELFNGDEMLQTSPLYIFAESYGGKIAAILGLLASKAIEEGELRLLLGGVALGDSWISPEDFVLSWGPILKDMSRIDNNGLKRCTSLAQQTQQQLAEGKYRESLRTLDALQQTILNDSNSVDFYNFMLDYQNDPFIESRAKGTKEPVMNSYSKYLKAKVYSRNGVASYLPSLMNGPVRKRLNIIPKNLVWKEHSSSVFHAMADDYMKPRIKEVDELLARGIKVVIYNGQLDLICSSKGAEAWIQKLKWDGLERFLSLNRMPIYCKNYGRTTKAFVKIHRNLHFYWILGAGHFVPFDQPCVSLEMVGDITESPASIF